MSEPCGKRHGFEAGRAWDELRCTLGHDPRQPESIQARISDWLQVRSCCRCAEAAHFSVLPPALLPSRFGGWILSETDCSRWTAGTIDQLAKVAAAVTAGGMSVIVADLDRSAADARLLSGLPFVCAGMLPSQQNPMLSMTGSRAIMPHDYANLGRF